MTEFLVRPETFGATVYEPRSLSYFFINRFQYFDLSSHWGHLHDDLHLGPDCPPDIRVTDDMSKGKFGLCMTDLRAGVSTARAVSSLNPLPADSLAAPIRVYLEVCLRCNANCSYCLNRAGSARVGELSTDELLKTIRNCSRDGVFEVRLTGGEPTLRPDFFEAARTVRHCGMALTVNSNLLITGTTLEDLLELRPNLLITSLDAAEEAHAKGRGKGYHRIARNVRILREADMPVRLNCVLSRDTLPHIERFIDEFAPLGCGFCFILIRPVGRGGETFDPPSLSEMNQVVQMIDDKRQEYPDVYFSTSFHVVMDKELTIGGVNLTGCNAIQKSFNVNSDGTVLPCAFLYELSPHAFTLGNIRQHDYSVLPIWRESELLRELRRRSSECNLRCIGCSRFKSSCRGTCVFMDLYSERTGLPDPYCEASVASTARRACRLGTQLGESR